LCPSPRLCYTVGVELGLSSREGNPLRVPLPVLGYCHICQRRAPVKLADLGPAVTPTSQDCHSRVSEAHWLCLDCESQFSPRGRAFVEDLIKGPKLDCCGPVARVA